MTEDKTEQISRQDERIRNLERWRDLVTARMDKMIMDVQKMREDFVRDVQKMREDFIREVQKIREDFGKRPSWSITIMLTILSTACGMMAVYIITNIE